MRTKLREGEKLLLEVRKHWVYLLDSIVAFVVFLILYFTTLKSPEYKEFSGLMLLGVFGSACFFLYRYYDRETNIWAVTNLRIIDEWGIVTRNVKESPLERIHNVEYHQGVVGLLLGYGDVKIQTAAEEGGVTNRLVERPKELKETITKAQDELRKKGNTEEKTTKEG